jgi:2-dehydro-3-deoxygluconokinase
MARLAPPGHLRWRQALPGSINVTWGGGEANVCASLAMFGQPARYVTALPRTPLAEAIAGTLRGLGVQTDHILWRKEGRLGLYFVEAGANQRGSTVIYDREYSAISLARPEEFDFAAALHDASWLHVTGITPAISETAFQSNLALVRLARELDVTVSCDLNFRKKLWNWRPGTAPRTLARQCMAEILKYVNIVIANEEDTADVLDIHAEGTDAAAGKIHAAAYTSVARQVVERCPNVSRVAITLRESLSADRNRWGALLYDAPSRSSSMRRTTTAASTSRTRSPTSSIASAPAIRLPPGSFTRFPARTWSSRSGPSPLPPPPVASNIRSRVISITSPATKSRR